MLSKLKDRLFSSETDLKTKIFYLLALTGFLVSISIFIASCFYGSSALNRAVLLSSALLSIALLSYSLITGKYYICYIITVVFIFMILFPIMFFTAGGYISGMPGFFVFAIAFTLFMLEGKIGIAMSVTEMAIYIACCIVAFNHPELVTPFPDEESAMVDIIIGFCVSSVALSSAITIQLRMYNKQQQRLEEAITEARKSNKAKGIFLANMSHEIRTPINVILGTNELISRSSDPDEIREYTSVIQSSGDHLLSIINNILDVTQIESGRILVSSKPYRTDSLISELASIGSRLCARKGLKFNTEVSPEMISMLEGDKNHLRQILTNFISNAVKYTEKGSITLTAETTVRDENEAVLQIKVSDTGVGISQKELSNLFEVFKRGKKAIESSVEGTGLGLAISKDLADSIGGKLIVESIENKGSTFGISIVQNICDSSPIGEINLTLNDRSCTDGFIAPGCRILAVDDNSENLSVIKMLLERTMITVDTALDGLTAADMASKTDYDLIFLDYMMPGTDGIETLNIIRKNGLSDNVPVIVLTAEALAGSEDKFLSAGFTSYLSKPVSWHELEKTLISHLPKDKITISAFSDSVFPEEELSRLSKELSKFDISLESGMSYLSGSIMRFSELAEIFVDGYNRNHDRIREMLKTKDSKLSFEVHSLKSVAKGVGALNLFEIARELEKRSKANDYDYVSNAETLLLFEWKRATDGMNYLISAVSEKKKPDVNEVIDSADLEMLIEKGLREHNWLDTQNALKQLMEQESEPEKNKNLTYIYEFVDELDFTSAQSLFKQIRR